MKKRAVLELLGGAFGGERCANSDSIECLRDCVLPIPEGKRRCAPQRPAVESSVAKTERRPLAELPPDGERERNVKDAPDSSTVIHVPAICRDVACLGKEEQASILACYMGQDGMSSAEQVHRRDCQDRHPRIAGNESAHVAVQMPWSSFSGFLDSPSFSTSSRAFYIQAITSGRLSPPLQLLWMAHTRGVMPLEEVILRASDALQSSLAVLLRISCVAAMHRGIGHCRQGAGVGFGWRGQKGEGSLSECRGFEIRGQTLEGDAMALMQILGVLSSLAMARGGSNRGQCGKVGIGSDDVCGRVRRRCQAIFDAICCPSATDGASPAECPLTSTLAFLLAVSQANYLLVFRQKSADPAHWNADSGARQTLEELARYRLKHLRFGTATQHDAQSSRSDFQSTRTAPPSKDIVGKSQEFWRRVAVHAGSGCAERVNADERVLEEAASLFMHLCGERECLEFVSARAASGCGRECALAALFLRHVLAASITSPSDAAAREVRELVENMARSALLNADQLALGSSILLMLFLSSSPPRFLSPHHLFATQSQEYKRWTGSVIGTGEQDGARRIFGSLKSWCVHDRWVKQLIFGGLAGGSAAGMTVKRCGPVVLQVLQSLVDCAAWPGSPDAQWHEERSLRLHLLAVADATALRSCVRDFSSLARVRLSDLNSRRPSATGAGVVGAGQGGRGLSAGNAIPGGWGSFEAFAGRTAQDCVHALQVVDAPQGLADRSHPEDAASDRLHGNGIRSSGSPKLICSKTPCLDACTDKSIRADTQKIFSVLATAVRHANVGDAEAALRGACASIRELTYQEYSAASTASIKEAAVNFMARCCVEGCVDLYVAHLQRSCMIDSGESANGALIWLMPIADMLGGNSDPQAEMGEALVALGSCMMSHVERLLIEKMDALVPVQIAALSALALALANAPTTGVPRATNACSPFCSAITSHNKRHMVWLYGILMRLVAASAGPMLFDGIQVTQVGCVDSLGGRGVVQLCMGLIMSAISLHAPMYLWDEQVGSRGLDVEDAENPSGVIIPRLAFDVITLIEELEAEVARTKKSCWDNRSRQVKAAEGTCRQASEGAFWEAWASAKLLPLRRAADRVPFRTLVLLCSTGFVPHLLYNAQKSNGSGWYIGILKRLLHDAAERQAGLEAGANAAAGHSDRLWIEYYAEAFAEIACFSGAGRRTPDADLERVLAGGNPSATDSLLVLFSEDAVVGEKTGTWAGREMERANGAKVDKICAEGMFSPTCEAGLLMSSLHNSCAWKRLGCERIEQACMILDLLPLPRLLKLFGIQRFASSSYVNASGGTAHSDETRRITSCASRGNWELASGAALGGWVEACLRPCFCDGPRANDGEHVESNLRCRSEEGGPCDVVTACLSYPEAACRLLVRLVCALYDFGGDDDAQFSWASSSRACEGTDVRGVGVPGRTQKGMVGKGLVQSSTFAADCLLLHLHAITDMHASGRLLGLASVYRRWCHDEKLSALLSASHVAYALTLAAPLTLELRSAAAKLLQENPEHRSLLARALALQAFAGTARRRPSSRQAQQDWLARCTGIISRLDGGSSLRTGRGEQVNDGREAEAMEEHKHGEGETHQISFSDAIARHSATLLM